MKKFLGIFILLIFIAAGVCAYIFPGTPYYYKCTHDFEITDSIWNDIPNDLPKLSDDYADFSTLGIRITAWNDMEVRHTNDEKNVIWANEDNSHMVCVNQERINENEDFLDMTGINHNDLAAYCKSAEKTTPESEYEFTKLTASLTIKDFDIHNYKNSKTFYKIMKKKNEDFCNDSGTPLVFYPVDGVGYRGYLRTSKIADDNEAIITIFPEKDKRTRYTIAFSLGNINEALSIAESIKLV